MLRGSFGTTKGRQEREGTTKEGSDEKRARNRIEKAEERREGAKAREEREAKSKGGKKIKGRNDKRGQRRKEGQKQERKKQKR